jgi:hypothetical protein
LGKGAGLVLPVCNTDAMTLHLAEVAQTVTPGAHAVVLMDQAGWHMTKALIKPENISIVPLLHEPSGRALNGSPSGVQIE